MEENLVCEECGASPAKPYSVLWNDGYTWLEEHIYCPDCAAADGYCRECDKKEGELDENGLCLYCRSRGKL